MNKSILIPVIAIPVLALITGLVIIPEIVQLREKTIDVMEENREWATGCEWNVYVDDNGKEIKYMVCFEG